MRTVLRGSRHTHARAGVEAEDHFWVDSLPPWAPGTELGSSCLPIRIFYLRSHTLLFLRQNRIKNKKQLSMRHNRLHLSPLAEGEADSGSGSPGNECDGQPGQTWVHRNLPQREAGPKASACSDAAKHKTKEASTHLTRLSKHTFLFMVCQDLNGEVETYFLLL